MPTAHIAVIGAESTVDIAGRRQLMQVPEDQRAAVREFMIDQYNATVATPWIAAERGYIDAVIEPSRTRLEIRHALQLLRDKEAAAEHNRASTACTRCSDGFSRSQGGYAAGWDEGPRSEELRAWTGSPHPNTGSAGKC